MDICKDAIRVGGLMPAAVNCANEEANLLFRLDKISFNDIPRLIKEASSTLKNKQDYSLQDVYDTDLLMRETVRKLANI
jgi:1-deoxy-D-xylulose-5-phosphate reductoisomerase